MSSQDAILAAGHPPPGRGPASNWQLERLQSLQAAVSPSRLLSREQVLEDLGRAIRQAIATGTPAALVLIDLNNFADLNATWGPAGGDQVLAAAGARVQSFAIERLGCATSTGHLDSDHFAVILPQVENWGALKDRAAELVRSLAHPYAIADRIVTMNARAAVTQIPSHARTVTTALGRGFRLLNSAARLAPDNVALSQTDAMQSVSTLMIERDLAAAIGSDQLTIALQPKMELETGTVRGAEALVRWRHPEQGHLPPPLFIEAAERSGLIFELGLRILRDTCRAANSLEAEKHALSIAVNVSPHQLAHPEFLSKFLEVIDTEGVSPTTISIEITETAAMTGGSVIGDALKALRRCGLGVAIDDFGTGFSNLSSLSTMQADTLKIDRSLIAHPEEDHRSAALLGITVQLARTFAMKTVAEGVETPAQLNRIRDLGCDYVQGYLTGRPVPVNDFASAYLKP